MSDRQRPDIEVLPPIEKHASSELERLGSAKYGRYIRFFASALSAIPWVGSIIGASSNLHAEVEQGRINSLQLAWMNEHQRKLDLLAGALRQVVERIEQVDSAGAQARVEDESYLTLVRKGFKVWSEVDTAEKRELLQKLLAHAGTTTITSDDVVRLFIEWIDQYHEAHFAIIAELNRNPGSTRGELWDALHGEDVREDSAEADLFKLLVSDLSLGRVIRQSRETTHDGQFLRKRRSTSRRSSSSTMESAFEDGKPYELTALGKQFVHYTLLDVSPRIGSPRSPGAPSEA